MKILKHLFGVNRTAPAKPHPIFKRVKSILKTLLFNKKKTRNSKESDTAAKGPHPPANRSEQTSRTYQEDSPPSFNYMLYGLTAKSTENPLSDEGIVFTPSTVLGDGRCLFRALVRLINLTRGLMGVTEEEETIQADELRAAATEELKKNRKLLENFCVLEEDFDEYVKKMAHPRTHGGEPELMMISKIEQRPIAVYIKEGNMYRRIQQYGNRYEGEPLRLLYSRHFFHYDAIIASTNEENLTKRHRGISFEPASWSTISS